MSYAITFASNADHIQRKTQGVVRMLSKSGQDPRLLMKKTLVHALVHLDIDM